MGFLLSVIDKIAAVVMFVMYLHTWSQFIKSWIEVGKDIAIKKAFKVSPIAISVIYAPIVVITWTHSFVWVASMFILIALISALGSFYRALALGGEHNR